MTQNINDMAAYQSKEAKDRRQVLSLAVERAANALQRTIEEPYDFIIIAQPRRANCGSVTLTNLSNVDLPGMLHHIAEGIETGRAAEGERVKES